jgi:hypothetical protein
VSWTRWSISQVSLPSVEPTIFGSYKHPNKRRVFKLVDREQHIPRIVVPNVDAEVMSDVNSSSEPVKLEDLQRILSNIGAGGVLCSDSEIDHILLVLFLFLLMIANFTRFNSSFYLKVLRTGQMDLSEFGINPSKYKWFMAPEPVA